MTLSYKARRVLREILADFGLIEHEIAELIDVLEDVMRREVDAQPPDQGTQRPSPPSRSMAGVASPSLTRLVCAPA